ncbi:MAG: DUF3841 domain-containing protein [Gammaproteobacteria bacterium]|nr:DUF3841 domain-containing protein [Gammaproteobacteria bacterium]
MRPIPVSRRRALFNASPNQLIRVYSRQHKDAWSKAQDIGYFTGDHGILDIDEETGIDFTYHKPYDWMKDQMAKVIPDFSGERPVWAYLKRPLHKGWWKLRPDFIQFTALVPRKRILFSDYELWHHPLNNWPIFETEQEDDEWWDKKPRPDPSYTWHKCLDISQEQNYKNSYCGYTDLIQGCIDRLYVDEIVSIKYNKLT